jgi:hypothetical protein
MKGLLDGMKFPIVGEPFDRRDRVAIGLHGQHETGTYRFTVNVYRAGATDAVFTSDVGSGEPEILAQEVAQ